MPSDLSTLHLASVIQANHQSANQATTLSVVYARSPTKKRG